MGNIEFFFDYTCPYAYLAATQIEGVSERTGQSLTWRPMLLGGVFRALDVPQVLFKTLSPSKARHNFADMTRWADMWNVPLMMPPEHPFRSVEALRATLALPTQDQPAFIHAVYKAYWQDGKNIGDRTVIREILDSCGLHSASAGPFHQDVKDLLRTSTDEAIERGVFGAPAIFINDQLYWGQDRLWMVEKELGGEFPLPSPSHDMTSADSFDFYFDVSSPFGYLGATQIEHFAKVNRVKINWRPIFLGGLFKSLGGPTVPLNTFSQSKRTFIANDMDRWAKHWNVTLNWPSNFPVMTVRAMRILLSLGNNCSGLAMRIFKAYWCDGQNIQSMEVLEALIAAEGLPANTIEAASDPTWKEGLIQATADAADRGVFGVPTFTFNNSLIWGQDRFLFLEHGLKGWRDPGATRN